MSFRSNSDDYDATQAMIDMININTNHLDGLRTECVLTEALTQKEIRLIETKLIRLFGKQSLERQIALLNKSFNVPSPQVRKWLHIVGLNDILIESIIKKIGDDFDVLLSLNQDQLNDLLKETISDDKRKMCSAMNNLKLFIEKSRVNDTTVNDLDLHWDSWDQTILKQQQKDHDLINEDNSLHNNNLDNEKSSSPASPLDESKKLFINSQEQLDIESTNSTSKSSKELKHFNCNLASPSTPPYSKNNLINYSSNRKFKINSNHNDTNYNLSMPKSKSHEEHLTNKIDKNNEISDLNYRRRLESEPCTDSKLHNSFSNSRSPPIASPDNFNQSQSDSCFEEQPSSLTNSYSNVNAPRSPRTQGMLHAIRHRFTNRITPKTVICNLCEKQMMFGFKCKECKYRCHKECATKVPPSCGLPPELFSIFKEMYNNNRQSPISSASNSNQYKIKKTNKLKTHNIKKSSPDSSSNPSSRNSSAPSSPIQPLTNATTTINNSSALNSKTFTFNVDETNSSRKKSNLINEKVNCINDNQFNQKLNQPLKQNFNNLNSLDAEITNKNLSTRLNSQDSQVSVDYDQTGDKSWPRQNSLTMNFEFDIPFDEVIKEKEIGTGRFGTVFKGDWHGSVAIKMFNMANGLDDRKALEAFKSEVATFRKTRHENLVLFMGACMSPPHLAIVTSYCKGHPLYYHLYERKDKFNLTRIIGISKQICQGMGYLHARGIIHKDLRSKNIFYDSTNNKVTIADFGFFSLTKLCFSNDKYKDRLKIPKNWLCYLAPELMKSLKAGNEQEQDDLPFSFSTDIFSFGTIWHELIFGFLPFEKTPAEVVIWQVGKGIKQSLVNLQASKEIKDILMTCWAYKTSERPEFSKLVDTLKNLPKKRLQRSPSHPTHLMTSRHLY